MSHRTQQTRLKIEAAVTELVERQSLDRISVKAICDRALVSRAAFYRLYEDKYHLVEEIFDAGLERWSDEVGAIRFHDRSDIAVNLQDLRNEAALIRLFEHFSRTSRIYSAIMESRGSAWFRARTRAKLTRLFASVFSGRLSVGHTAKVPPGVGRNFLAGAFMGVAESWPEGAGKHSPAQMASWFRRIVYKGYIGALTGID